MPHPETPGFVDTGPGALSVDPEPKETRVTRYEISVHTGGLGDADKTLQLLGVIDATSGPAAIRAWHKKQPATNGVRLRAVPVRNITELTVSVAQVQEVRFT